MEEKIIGFYFSPLIQLNFSSKNKLSYFLSIEIFGLSFRPFLLT